MPFTPFHMGPGIAIKAMLQGSFSLMVFGYTQVLMDLQPLVALLTGAAQLHGFSHTYLGALLIAGFAAATGKGLSEWGLRWLGISAANPLQISWPVSIGSALIGAFSHVVLDSVMHLDMQPYYPFSESNHLLHVISVAQLQSLCMWSGLVGGVIYCGVRIWLGRGSRNGINWR